MLTDYEISEVERDMCGGERLPPIFAQAREANRLRAELADARKEIDRLREGQVDTFCKAAREWRNAIDDAGDSRVGVSVADIDNVFRAITKSNLLWRLIYGEREVRTERCEKHGGHWSGLPSEPEHDCCDLTGWKRGPAALRMIAAARAALSAEER
jgi:hypothetical protein